jgi:hypothetical protein
MRKLTVAWALVAIVVSGALSAGYGPDVGRLSDGWHVAGHLVLFGGLAILAATATRAPAWAVLAGTVAVGLAVEAAQMAGAGHLMLREAAFDGLVDALAAMAGLAVARAEAAELLGIALHPAFVFPVGLFGTFYAAERDAVVAVTWAAVGTACLVPAAAGWLIGVHRGWFADVDLKDRADRPPLFALGFAASTGFAVVAWAWAPPAVAQVALGTALLAAAITASTTAGFKVSGHVAVSLLLAVAIAPYSWRGPLLFVGSGTLLSWARVRAGCHRPSEVAGAWALAAMAAAI